MRRIIKKIIGAAVFCCIIFFIFVFANHKVRLGLEAKKYPPIGTMVEVNGHKMHVYSEGEGKETFIFLPGWSTSSPVWDFKGLYSKLSDQNHIVVVERAGYGYSEVSDSSRDLDTVLEETRQALALVGEAAPFVLIPHSVAGLEAVYWAQKYPDEVKSIIGLDISFPETYENIETSLMEESMKQQKRASRIQNFGFIRFASDLFEGHEPLIFDLLGEAEKPIYKACVYRSYYTKDMIREGYAVLANARKVGALAAPKSIPMFLFIATEQGDAHLDLSLRYLAKMRNGQYQVLDGGHYIHDFRPEEIAVKIKEFTSKL